MQRHRHRQAEIYLGLEGTGLVEVGSGASSVGAGSVGAGTAVFVPGDELHRCENTGASDLRLAYVFPADSLEKIEYVFDG